MTDDPDQIRAAARLARRLADDARGAASDLRRADGVQWQSTAAAFFRQRLRDRGRELGGCADDLDHLGLLLDRHADAVATLERRARAGLDAVTPWNGLVPG